MILIIAMNYKEKYDIRRNPSAGTSVFRRFSCSNTFHGLFREVHSSFLLCLNLSAMLYLGRENPPKRLLQLQKHC